MEPALLGVDAGTSTTKSVAFAPDGTELARAARENAVSTPRDGWKEQDMAETWDRTVETIHDVVDELDDGTVVAVGVTGQGAGCRLLDGAGRPVRNAILWNDGRAADVVAGWREDGTHDDLFERTGHGYPPGLSAPILRWLADNEPGTLDRAETLLFCKDWVRYRLTGTIATDPTEASLIHHDVGGEGYLGEVPELAGVPGLAELAPPIRAPDAVAGTVTDEAATATGLEAGTPVVTGTMDVAASAYGSGVAEPGVGSSVIGTTLQNQLLLDRPRIVGPPVGYTLDLGIDGMGLRAMGAMTGTPNLEWVREHVAATEAFETLESAAESVPVGAGGVLYHPYLSPAGEKAPFLDPDARAGFVGLEPSHTRAHLLRAVYEGVALAARDCYEHVPAAVDSVAVSGGGARSAFWTQLFADCLDATVTVPAGTEFGARGAAILAGLSQDRYPDLPTAVDRTVTTQRTHHPRPGPARRYDRWYRVYTTARDGLADAWALRSSVLDEFDR